MILGIAVGAGIGMGIGAAVGSPLLWIVASVTIGIALGTTWSRRQVA